MFAIGLYILFVIFVGNYRDNSSFLMELLFAFEQQG